MTTQTNKTLMVEALLRLRAAAVQNKRAYVAAGEPRAIAFGIGVLRDIDARLRALGVEVL